MYKIGIHHWLLSQGYVPDMLYERRQDGSLTLPAMEQVELRDMSYSSEGSIRQLQDRIRQTIRKRVDNPTAHRIGHLRLPKTMAADPDFQEELERYIPSLVLL